MKQTKNQMSKKIDVPIKMEIVDIIIKDKNGNVIKDDLNEWYSKTRPNNFFGWKIFIIGTLIDSGLAPSSTKQLKNLKK